jgi:CIC family chloride channel protein
MSSKCKAFGFLDLTGERIAALGIFANFFDSKFFKHRLLRKYTALVNEDLTATYSRDMQKWLLVAPIIGVLTGLIITGIAVLILNIIWKTLLPFYLVHHGQSWSDSLPAFLLRA